jgi:hypothetical protein
MSDRLATIDAAAAWLANQRAISLAEIAVSLRERFGIERADQIQLAIVIASRVRREKRRAAH